MKVSVLLILILLFGAFTNDIASQVVSIDSLNSLLEQNKNKDTVRVNLLNELAYQLTNINPDESLKYAIEANRLSDSLNFKKGKAEAFFQMTNYYSIKSDFKMVLEYAHKSLELFTTLDNKKGMAQNMRVLGKIYYYRGELTRAMDYLQEALAINISLQDSLGICYICASLGTDYSNFGEYEKALDYEKKALEMATEISNEEAVSYALNNLGVVYETQGNFPKALECYQKSFRLDESHMNYKDAAVSASNIAGILKFQGNYISAIEFCQKGIEYAAKIGYKTGLTYNYEYLGHIYKLQGDYDKAWHAHQKNMDIQEEIGNQQGVAMAYCDMANLHVLQRKLDSALYYYNKSIKLSKTIAYRQIEADCYVGIAQINYNKQNYNRAYKYSKKGYGIATDIGNINTIKNSANILALSCEALGFFKEAYRAQVSYKVMSDSLFNDLNIKKIANLEYQYKYEKEKEILEIDQKRKDKLAAFEIRKQKVVRNILIGGIAIILLFMFIILRGLIQKRLANEVLKIKNDEIANQAEELKVSNESLVQLSQFKEDMTNMVIHDLKNPLSAIINIDSIQEEERRKTIIKHSGFKMMNLVENILEVYKYESAEIELLKENVDLFELVKNSIEEVEFLAEKKELEFKVDINVDLFVHADSRVLRRIIVNILSNAVKFALVKSTIAIKGFVVDSGNLKVEIHNFGSYIPPEKQELIFDKFGQVDRATHGRISSTGLGLAFCKLAVRAHNGNLGVLSDENDGTVFWFMLPDANFDRFVGNISKNESINTVMLSDIEKKGLLSLHQRLLKLSVCDFSSYEDVFEIIERENLANEKWISALQDSIYNCNEFEYKGLVNMIIE